MSQRHLLARDRAHLIHPQHDRNAIDGGRVWVRGEGASLFDADGGELHGYVRSPTAGWTDYYRDLMGGNVLEGGKRLGIPGDAWMA